MSYVRRSAPARNRIGKYRGECGLSKAALGREIGRSRETIRNWEALETSPSVPDAIELMRLFDVTFEELFPPDWIVDEEW